MPGTTTEVVIVGGGASAAMLAHELGRRGVAAAVIERAGAGRGLAYRTRSAVHLLNVPAGRMSAVAGEADHFVRWLRRRDPAADAHAFARRGDYGDYLAELLDASGARVIAGEAVEVGRVDGVARVGLQGGRFVEARACVLALGHRPPAVPEAFARWREDPRVRADPWEPGALDSLPAGPVLLVGTGLTAIDVALALDERGHRGPLVALSRHGLPPRSHHLPLRFEPIRLPARPTVRGLLRALRDASDRAGDWRAVVDGLRPHVRSLWRAWPLEERRRFLRHARAFWDVHRHRTAPEAAAGIERMQRDGYLSVHAGRILAVEEAGERGLRVRWRRRGGGEGWLRVASAVICTSAAPRRGGADEPLVASLIEAGLAAPDALGLGLATDGAGALLDAAGVPTGLYAIGPLRIPAEWESTAVPELREQAAELAERLAADLPAAVSPAPP